MSTLRLTRLFTAKESRTHSGFLFCYDKIFASIIFYRELLKKNGGDKNNLLDLIRTTGSLKYATIGTYETRTCKYNAIEQGDKTMEENKAMAVVNIENYTITSSIAIGDREVFIGELKAECEGKRYVCGYKKHIDNSTAAYNGILDSDYYIEIAEHYGQRITDAARTSRREELEKRFK